MRRKKILVIDDEPDFVDMLKMRLESNGYEVVSAYDGPSGLDLVLQENPQLIVLDIMMPGMDGFDVLRELHKDERMRYIPVVMLTAKGETKSIFRAQDLGATDYLIKPFEASDLLSVVGKYL